MKTTKLINKLATGCSIKINYLDGSKSDKAIVLEKSTIGRYNTSAGYAMDEDLSIPGVNGTIAICEIIPFKRHKFRYKR